MTKKLILAQFQHKFCTPPKLLDIMASYYHVLQYQKKLVTRS